jgi:hypothetical protein
MNEAYATHQGAEVILARLRRLVTIWRATYIIQMILLLLLVLSVGLEVSLPGVLAMLLRSELGAQLLIPGILVPLLALDPVAGVVELRMGRQLRVERIPLRRVLTFLYMVPGVMLLRRSLLVGLALLWLNVIIVALVLWFTGLVLLAVLWLNVIIVALVLRFTGGLVLLAVLMRAVALVGQIFGKVVDVVDRFLNWLYTVLRQTLREIALSPTSKIEDEEDIVIPLLVAQLDE